MDLKNYLPQDGIVHYWPAYVAPLASQEFYEQLTRHIEWRSDEVMMFGKRIITKRKVAWYATEAMDYRYSGINRKSLPWTPLLAELQQLVVAQTGASYNSCLLNLYHDGSEHMGWHADNEKELMPQGSIASLSFGAERKFVLKHRETQEKVEFMLANGDLLEMKGSTQTHWLHRITPTKKIKEPRISLTFRMISSN